MRVPLYLRILGWFFLNLLLLVLIFVIFFRFQLHFGLDSLLAGRAGDRLNAVSRLIESELRFLPRENWGSVLQRFDAAYGIRFAIYAGKGDQLAGEPLALPPELRGRMTPPPRRDGPPGPVGPPEFPDPPEFPGRPPGQPERPNQPIVERQGPNQPPPPDVWTNAFIRAGVPQRYWAITHLVPNEQIRRGPLFLVMVSDTLSAGGLIFDPMPWLAVGLGVLIISVIFWLPLVRGITRAISQMTSATGEIAGGNFTARAPEERGDEIGSLGRAINQMATRLAGFIQGQKRFLGDTAHELVSPLARMEMALGILDQRASDKDRPYVEDVREEVRHMSDLVNELLSFSKSSLGASKARLQSVSVHDVVEKTLKREGAGEIVLDIEPGLNVLADPELLQRGLGNVIRNALRHAGDPKTISVAAIRAGKEIILTVSDQGPGVPEHALSQLFDPFFRLDASRDRETGGVGLGLAITKSCIEACGGTVSCRNRQPHGLEVIFTLPA